MSSSGGGMDARLVLRRRRQRKNASAARAITATGTPTAGPIMLPRFFGEGDGEGV